MSWSGTCKITELTGEEKAAGNVKPPEDAINDIVVQWNECPERDEQVAVAKTVARFIVSSGMVGKPPLTVTIGGHANPNHEKGESISVSVYS